MATIKRRRRGPLAAVLAGLFGTLALLFSMTGTVSGFTASITNSTNTAAVGGLTMTETLLDAQGNPTATVCKSNDGSPTSVASNSATCAAVNKYGGGALYPGATVTTRVRFTNSGTVPVSAFTLNVGPCAVTAQAINGGASTTNVCGKFNVTITSGNATVKSGTAASPGGVVSIFPAVAKTTLTPGDYIDLQIRVTLDSSADNSFAGFSISQLMTWTFNA